MQAPGHPRIEVVINRGSQGINGAETKRLRPLSVDEALQYSPLTTSITSGLGRWPYLQDTYQVEYFLTST